jgi:RimJ/RimL family protein N-acetyltransferase
MKTYKYLDIAEYKNGNYLLLPIRRRDIYKIKDWRNAQIDVLRQEKLLTDDEQTRYFDEVIQPSFSDKKPDQILFSYLYKNECIGYGGFVHIDWPNKTAEISFLVDDKRAKDEKTYRKDFENYLELVKEIAFTRIGFQKIFTETYAFRKQHIAILENAGLRLKRAKKPSGSFFHEISYNEQHA